MTATCLLDRGRGSASRICFQEEDCWATVARSGHQPRGLDIVSETMRDQRNKIESQLIRFDRMRAKAMQGNQRPGGDLNGELQPETVSIILRHALCKLSDVETLGSGPYRHHFVGGADLSEGLTIEKRFNFRSADDIVLQYPGSRVNEFFMQANTEGILSWRAGILSKREIDVTDGPFTSSSEDDSIEAARAAVYRLDNWPFNSYQVSLQTEGDTIGTITSFDWTLTNNMDGDGFALNETPYRIDITDDVRSITGNFVAFFTPSNYDRFYDAYKNNSELSLRMQFNRGDSRKWEILFPAITLGGEPTPQIAGRGPISLPFTFDVARDDQSGIDVSVWITNSERYLGTAA